MPHTMREVARRAGVSLATVSRVLNNTQYISEETRRRVLDAVREFNYFKNVHARRLATGRSDLFGLVISETANPYFPEIIRAIRQWRGTADLTCCFATRNMTGKEPRQSCESSGRVTFVASRLLPHRWTRAWLPNSRLVEYRWSFVTPILPANWSGTSVSSMSMALTNRFSTS